jgi:hypothetical protein
MFHLVNAETKTWICLDGDLETELNYSYDDPTVVANGLGIMSKVFYEKQTFSHDRVRLVVTRFGSDEDDDQYYMSEEENE